MKIQRVLYLLSLLVYALPSHAAKGSHGGLVVFCRDKANGDTLQVLDVAEAKPIYGLEIAPNDRPVQEQLNGIAARIGSINPLTKIAFESTIRNIKKISVRVKRLNLLDDDTTLLPMQNGCQLKQLAVYHDGDLQSYGRWGDEKLEINDELFSSRAMTNQNIVALLVHEAVYKIARVMDHALNSSEARQMTAHLMAKTFDKDSFFKMFSRSLPSPARFLSVFPSATRVVLRNNSPVTAILQSQPTGARGEAKTGVVAVEKFPYHDSFDHQGREVIRPATSGSQINEVTLEDPLWGSMNLFGHKAKVRFYQDGVLLQDQTGRSELEIKSKVRIAIEEEIFEENCGTTYYFQQLTPYPCHRVIYKPGDEIMDYADNVIHFVSSSY